MPDFPRICVSAACGGGGKTMLALGLARAFRASGLAVKPFKKGPDYIDAAWLGAACGCAASNLDPFFQDAAALRELFTRTMGAFDPQKSLAIIEGNRGLFDGLNETGSCSTAQVARAVASPILLCLDCAKSTRTMAALIKGLTEFEPGLAFAGVILNRVGSARHEASLRRAIASNTDLPVLGAIPRLERNPLPERHMGIASSGRGLHVQLDAVLAALEWLISGNCDLAAILNAARTAPSLPAPPAMPKPVDAAKKPVIGIVRDAALWFYYEENLQALRAAGAEVREISLLNDDAASWRGLNGIYLGGGFPEDYAQALSVSPRLAALRQYAANGTPIYAECGGLMLLCAGIRLQGELWPMAGVFAAVAEWLPKPQGLGYVEATIAAPNPFYPVGMSLRGHEFHYSRLVFPRPENFCIALARGVGIGNGADGIVKNNVFAAYTHIFAPAVPAWAQNFVERARENA